MRFTIAITIALAITAAHALTEENSEHIKNYFAMKNIKPFDPTESQLITYEPIAHGYRAITVPRKFLDKVLPKVPTMLGFEVNNKVINNLMERAMKCNNEIIEGTIADQNGNLMTKEGFSFKEMLHFISCKNTGDKLEMVFFTNSVKGTYTTIQTIETVCKKSKIDPTKEECNDVIKHTVRKWNKELRRGVKSSVARLFNSLSLQDL